MDRGANEHLLKKSMRAQVHLQIPECVETLWTDLNFNIVEGKSQQRSFSSKLDKSKVQFAFTGNRRNISIDILKEQSIELDVREGIFNVSFNKTDMIISDPMNFIENIFETHIINKYESKQLSSEEKGIVLKSLKEKVPLTMKHGKAAIYYCKNDDTLNVVGEISYFQGTVESLGLKEQTKILEAKINFEESVILGYCGFEQYLKEKYNETCIAVDILQKPPTCKITSAGISMAEIIQEKARFIRNLKTTELRIKDQRACNLLFLEDRYPNQSLYLFLQGKLNDKKRRKEEPRFCIIKSSDNRYDLYCRDKIENELANIIKENIIITDTASSSTTFLKGLERWIKSNRLLIIEETPRRTVFCCISDIHADVLNVISSNGKEENTKCLPLPNLVVKFLKFGGSQLLESISEMFGVEYSFENSTLNLTGDSNKTTEAKSYLNEEICKLRKSIPLELPKTSLEIRQSDIEDAMQEKECCWQIQDTEKQTKMLPNCEYLVSWKDPLKQLEIIAVKGYPWHMDVDLQIVFTNCCLYPVEVELLPMNAIEKYIDRTRGLVDKNGGMFDVGHYTDVVTNLKGEDTSDVVALVVTSNEGKDIQGKEMQQKLKEILKKNINLETKTVCFTAYTKPKIVDVVKQMIEATLQFAENQSISPVRELFVCCMPEPNEAIDLKIDDMFRLKRGYCRKIHSNDANVRKAIDPNLNVVVETGSLHKSKADAIVNTTSWNLDLTKGKVSEELLKLAGQTLLQQCKTKYPDGLHYGEIAVTDAHDLKKSRNIKYIYHVALPDYKYDTFEQVVKMYVKLCLYQAEKNECTKIAFPAFGVGKLRYPRRETAAAMFEAVDEFCSEALNPKLKKVKFVVHELDEKTCKAFFNEEWRLGKACRKELGDMRQYVKTEFRALELTTEFHSIRIATTEDYRIPPSHAVQILFKGGSGSLKQAMEYPKTWTDQFQLNCFVDDSIMTKSLRNCLEMLVKERVTEAVFCTETGKATSLPVGVQVRIIYDVLKTHGNTQFPKKIIIIVEDESGLQNAAQMLNTEKQVSPIWSRDSKKQKCSIELIGKNKASLDAAETYIKDIVKQIEKEGTILATKIQSTAGENKKEKIKEKSKVTDRTELENTYEVTAELNPGIFNFKKELKEWESWASKIEKKFKVKLRCCEDAVSVGGSFSNILELEHYLENSPDLGDPAMFDCKTINSDDVRAQSLPIDEDFFSKDTSVFVEMSENEYQAFMFLCKQDSDLDPDCQVRISYNNKRGGLLLHVSKSNPQAIKKQIDAELPILKRNQSFIEIQGEKDLTLVNQTFAKLQKEQKVFCCIAENQENIYVTGLDKNLVDKALDVISNALQQKKPDQEQEVCYNFSMSDLRISVQKGDITCTEADCIAVQSPVNIARMSFQSKNIVGKLSFIKGSKFKENCLESAKKEGQCLKDYECRVIGHCGLQSTDKVMLVNIPYFHSVGPIQLKKFEEILFNIFCTADDQHMETLALPLLASDKEKGGFSKANSAQQFIVALKRFQKERKHIRMIKIVDKNEEAIEAVTSCLEDLVRSNEAKTGFPDKKLTESQEDLHMGMLCDSNTQVIFSTNLSVKTSEDAEVYFVDELYKCIGTNSTQDFSVIQHKDNKEDQFLNLESQPFINHEVIMIMVKNIGTSGMSFSIVHAAPPNHKMIAIGEDATDLNKTMEEVMHVLLSKNVKTCGITVPLELNKKEVLEKLLEGTFSPFNEDRNTMTKIHFRMSDEKIVEFIWPMFESFFKGLGTLV